MAAPAAFFLDAPFHLGTQPGTRLQVKGAGAGRAVQGPGGKRQGVHAQFPHVHGHPSQCRHGIGMHDYAAPPDGFGDFAHGLDGPGLVVREHDGDEDGIVPQGPRNPVRLHDAVAVHGNPGDREPLPFQRPGGIQHGVMLDAGYDDMPAPGRSRLGQALDGQVVRFRAAGREYDFFRLGADQSRDPAAGQVQRASGLHSGRVQA